MSEKESSTNVSISRKRNEIHVAFEYQPEAAQRMARIDGAQFDKEASAWIVPKERKEELDKAVADIEKILLSDHESFKAIEKSVNTNFNKGREEYGLKGFDIVISSYHDPEWTYQGEVIEANGGYAAQLTGADVDEHKAYVTLHRQSSLDRGLFKGDRVKIGYNEKGRGTVTDLPPDFEKSIGKKVDGVLVERTDSHYKVAFDYDSTLATRINRIDGAQFDKESRATFVPLDKHEFVVRAVNDMRAIFKDIQVSEREMRETAAGKMTGAQVVYPTRQGGEMTGQVVDSNKIHVLQHTGRQFFTLHKKDELDREPSVGSTVKIKYDKGRGAVEDRSRGREAGHGR